MINIWHKILFIGKGSWEKAIDNILKNIGI